jgi:hypothetical protein
MQRFFPSSQTRSPSLYLGISRCLTHDCCALIMKPHAWSRASFSCLRHNVTLGIGDVAWIQSACGLKPISRKNGDFLVISDGQLLCANCAIRRWGAQFFCFLSVIKCMAVSSHWFVHSDCPSVLGWYAVDGACLTPVTLHAACMNLDMNRGSLSLITLEGNPKWANMCWCIMLLFLLPWYPHYKEWISPPWCSPDLWRLGLNWTPVTPAV